MSGKNVTPGWPASPRPAFLSIVKSSAAPLKPLPSTQDRQTSCTTRAKLAMQAGDHATDGEEASINNDLDQDNGNRDDEGDKHGDRKSGSGDGDNGDEDDGNSDSDGLLTTLKRDNLIAWIAAHNIEPQGKQATKKEIIKVIMAAVKSEHPSKEDVKEIIESHQAKCNVRTA
ncbi:hypothetical protein EDB86DRAFT_2827211 [Lactarius hatsudake]|nr:hypothetical protein EDB86DRAFT_2827211 [Lactarius hatsudake]